MRTANPWTTLLLCLQLSTGVASAATYYVATQDPAAADTNPGTQQAPWKTITQACRTAQAGDTVMIKQGTYREMLMPRNSGKPAAPIIFQAYPDDFVMIKGSEPVTGFRKEGNVWIKRPWHKKVDLYWRDEYKQISDAPYRESARQQQVFVDEQPLQWVPSREELSPGSFLWDSANAELLVYPSEAVADLNQHLVEVPVRTNVVCAWEDDVHGWTSIRRHPDAYDASQFPAIHHIHIKGLHFRHAARAHNRAGVRLDGEHWLLENCTVEYMNAIGVGTYGSYNVVRNCEVSHNGQSGFAGAGYHTLIEDCKSYFNNYRRYATWWGGGGNKWCFSGPHTTIRRTTSGFNRGMAFWFDLDAEHVIIEDCVAVGNWHSLADYFYEVSWDGLIKDNIAFGCHPGTGNLDGAGIALQNSCRVRVEGNIIISCEMGILINEGERDNYRGQYNCFDNIVQGNTLLDIRDYVARLTTADNYHPADPANRNIFRNNHFLHTSTSPLFSWNDQEYNNLQQFEADHFWVADNHQLNTWDDLSEARSYGTMTQRERIDYAFGRILQAIAPDFSDIDPATVKLADAWYLAHNRRSVGYSLDVAGSRILLVDIMQPIELDFALPEDAAASPKVFSALAQKWTELDTLERTVTIPFEPYVSVVTGLPAGTKPISP